MQYYWRRVLWINAAACDKGKDASCREEMGVERGKTKQKERLLLQKLLRGGRGDDDGAVGEVQKREC